jgi:hypothetical protein
LRIAGFSSCWYWNGAEVKCDVISSLPDSIAAVPSGWLIPTVNLSSTSNLPGPNVFSAIICSMIACTDTFGAGSAIRSLSVKSRTDRMFGLRVVR